MNEIQGSKPKIVSHKLSTGVSVFDASPFIITKFSKQGRFKIQHSRFDNFHFTGFYQGRSTFKVNIPNFWQKIFLACVNAQMGVFQFESSEDHPIAFFATL